jgi:predicted esterase
LAREPVRLAWTPDAEKATASYELIARVSYADQELGALSKAVYAPTEIRQWTLDLLQRLERLDKTRDVSREALAHVLLKIEKADLLWKKRATQGLAPEEIHRELRTASRWVEDIQEGKPVPGPLGPGVHEMAYLARQDDSAQPYYLHIPHTYTGQKPAPAIVYLHGYAPDLDKTNWHMPSTALTDEAETRGYVLIIPFARSNTDFQGIGETDVLRVLELANQKLKLDRGRTVLVGYSMGGMGAYTIAAHRPHLWAGVVALCARADYCFWKGLDREKVVPWKRHLIEAEFGWPLAANFRYVPVLAYQGTSDMLIKPRQAYRFVDKLDRLGADARVVRLDGQDHWIADAVFSTPEAFDWMDARRREPAPRTIRFKTYSLRHNRAYWATIDAFTNQGIPASVDLTLEEDGKLTLVSENVARLTLRPPKELVPPGSFLHATVNGKGDRFRPEKSGEYVVRLAKVPDVKRRKRPGLCGPIKDAFNDRFILVYGTQGGEEATERNRKRAESFRRDWYRFAKGLPRIIPDTRLTKTHIAVANLFLFGTPKTHAFLADIAGELPIRFTEDGCRILHWTYAVNEKRGLMFICPNPKLPDHYVVVCAGAPYGRDLPVNHKYDLLPDFIVYGTETDYDDTNVTYAAGFFDNLWQLKESLLWRHDGTPRPKPQAVFAPAAPREAVPE